VTIDKSGSNLAALHAVNAERETTGDRPGSFAPDEPLVHALPANI
jgi:hypothetical protein